MTTLAQIVAATQDADLSLQLAAAAAVAGVPAPDLLHWTYQQLQRLAAADVGGGRTVASHHAADTLTDAHLLAAVRSVAQIEG